MEKYIVLSFLAALTFAVNPILYKIAKNIDPVAVSMLNFASAFLFTLIYWVFFYKEKHLSPQGIWMSILAGFVSFIAFTIFVVALRLGKVSVVSTIRQLSVAITVILAITFLAEKISFLKVIGIILAIIGAVLLSI